MILLVQFPIVDKDTTTTDTMVNLRHSFHALWRRIRSYKKELIFMTGLGLVSAVANGLVPYVTGRFFDALIDVSKGVVQTGWPLWATVLAAWFFVQVVANNIDWILDRKRRKVTTHIHTNILADGYDHVLHLPLAYHKNERINDVLEKLSRASWQMPAIIRTMVDFGPQMLSVIIGLVLVLSIHPPMALILGTGVVLYIILLLTILPSVAMLDVKAQKKWVESSGDAHSAVQQIESVKNATAEGYETSKIHHNLNVDTFSLWTKLEFVWSNVNFFQRTIVFVTQLVVFIFSVHLIADGTITIGELVALNGYAAMFFGPFVSLGYNWEVIQNGLTSARLADKIFAEPQEIYIPKDAESLGDIQGKIEFKNVSFNYSDKEKEILRDVSFIVKPGQSIALVGESGVGKSTAISLISGYYFPTVGSVLVDDVDTRTVTLESLRTQIAVVPQEIALFNDTLANNITYGAFDATMNEIVAASKQAHIDDFISNLADGYDTIVGERGMKLSVGQKQRIAIARAILRDPAILILDEPTSALDARTEQSISLSLEKLMHGRTTFIVAHRLSTTRKADLILVFDKGTIVESGTYQELIAVKNGVYRRLHEYQIGLRD